MTNRPRRNLSPSEQATFDNLVLEGLAKEDVQMMTLALDNGANPETLNVVLREGLDKYSEDMIKFALIKGANPDVLLFTGIQHKKFNWEFFEHNYGFKMLKMAIEHGADVNAAMAGIPKFPKESAAPEPAIHWTLFHDHIEFMECLIEKGADVDTPDSYGDTPLMNAILFKMPQRAAYLMEKGADPMKPCNRGAFPLKVLQESDKYSDKEKTWLLKLMMIQRKADVQEQDAQEQRREDEETAAVKKAFEKAALAEAAAAKADDKLRPLAKPPPWKKMSL